MTAKTKGKGRTFWLARDDDGWFKTSTRKMTLGEPDEGEREWQRSDNENIVGQFCSRWFLRFTPTNVHLKPGQQVKVQVTDTGWEVER